jgi:hypothetical protein
MRRRRKERAPLLRRWLLRSLPRSPSPACGECSTPKGTCLLPFPHPIARRGPEKALPRAWLEAGTVRGAFLGAAGSPCTTTARVAPSPSAIPFSLGGPGGNKRNTRPQAPARVRARAAGRRLHGARRSPRGGSGAAPAPRMRSPLLLASDNALRWFLEAHSGHTTPITPRGTAGRAGGLCPPRAPRPLATLAARPATPPPDRALQACARPHPSPQPPHPSRL